MANVTEVSPGDSEALARMKQRLSTERAVIRAWLRGFRYEGNGPMHGMRMTEEQLHHLAEGHRLGGELIQLARKATSMTGQG